MGVWRCINCNRTNVGNQNMCICGMYRGDSERARMEQAASETPNMTQGNWAGVAGYMDYTSYAPEAQTASPSGNGGSVDDMLRQAEVLEKYKQLLDMGAITQEEYEELKRKIFA